MKLDNTDGTNKNWHNQGCFILGERLKLSGTDEDELYLAMDWLLSRQEEIEKSLASIHLVEAALVLYDVSSTYFEAYRRAMALLHN